MLDVVCNSDPPTKQSAYRFAAQGRREQNRRAQYAFRQRRKAVEVA